MKNPRKLCFVLSGVASAIALSTAGAMELNNITVVDSNEGNVTVSVDVSHINGEAMCFMHSPNLKLTA